MASNLLLFAVFVFSMFMMSLNHRKKRKRIIFFGDSITEHGALAGGYITRILQRLREEGIEDNYELAGAGVSGDKIYDLYLRIEQDILSKGADIVVIYIGINDVWDKKAKLTGTEINRFEAFYTAIINKLAAAGIATVLCTLSVIGENAGTSNGFTDDLEMYCSLIRRLAKKNDLPLVDLRKAFLTYNAEYNPENNEQGILTVDGVHLNPRGNQFVADKMWTVLSDIKM